MMDKKLKKWLKWIDVIHDEIQNIVIAKNIFWRIQSIIESNPNLHKPSIFYTHLGSSYVSHVAMGIRRQIKIDDSSISIAHLLKEIVESPSSLSREYFVGLYKGTSVEKMANIDFDNLVGVGWSHINPVMACNDLAKLREMARTCGAFADQRIAHRDKRDPKSLPTFSELDECVNFLDELYVKYHLLFRAQCMETVMPVIQYDWEAVFREPWINTNPRHEPSSN